jgi:prepilin-type N-terminal cleavage/methylation domain-containing protein
MVGNKKTNKLKLKGTTLVEVLVAMSLLGIMAILTISVIDPLFRNTHNLKEVVACTQVEYVINHASNSSELKGKTSLKDIYAEWDKSQYKSFEKLHQLQIRFYDSETQTLLYEETRLIE